MKRTLRTVVHGCLAAGATLLILAVPALADSPTTRPDRAAMPIDKILPDATVPADRPDPETELPAQAAELLAEADTLFEQRRGVLAVVKLEKALTYAPRSRRLHRKLGQVHMASGNPAKAELHLSRVVRQQPNDAEAWYWLGKAQDDLGRPADAMVSLLKAHRASDPPADSPAALLIPYQLGKRLAGEGYDAAALAQLEKVLAGTAKGQLSNAQLADTTLFELSRGGRADLASEVARLKIATGAAGDAEEILRSLPPGQRGDRSAQVSLLWAQVRQGKSEQAAKVLAGLAKAIPSTEADDFVDRALKTFESPAQFADLASSALPASPKANDAPLAMIAAIAQSRAGRGDAAIGTLEKLSAGNWTLPAAVFAQLADWQLDAKKYDAATQTLVRGVLSGLERNDLGRPVLDRVDRLVEAVDKGQAAKLADSLKTDFPVDANSYVRGRLLGRAGQVDAALTELARANELRPKFQAAYIARMRVLLSSGREDAALAVLVAAVKDDIHSATLHHLAGHIHMGRGEVEKAISQLRRAEQLDRDDTQIVLDLADAYAAGDQPMAALRRLRRLYEMDAGNPDVLLRLARVNSGEESWDEASFYAGKLLQMRPNSVEAALIRGLALLSDGLKRPINAGKLSEGLQTLRKLAKDHADDARAHLALGRALLMVADDGEAQFVLRQAIDTNEIVRTLSRALELDAGLSEARRLLAGLLQARGRPAEALAHYEILLKAQPNDPELSAAVVELLITLGRLDDAVARLEAAESIPLATRIELAMQLADRATAARQPQKALPFIEKLLQSVRSSADRRGLMAAQATLLSVAGQHAKAVAIAEQLHRENPDNVQLAERYLQTLRDAQQWDKAVALVDSLAARATESENQTVADHWSARRIAVYQDARRTDEAIKAAEAYYRASPEDYGRLRLYVATLLEAEREDEAVKLLQSVVTARPNDLQAVNLYVVVLMQAKRYDTAAEILKVRIRDETDTDMLGVWRWRLVTLYVAANEPAKAVAEAEGWYEKTPHDLETVSLYLEALSRAKQYEKILKVIEKAQADLPANEAESLAVFRIEAMVHAGKADEADKAIAAWVAAQPEENRPDAWYRISHIFSMARKTAKSRQALEQTLALSPTHTGANNDYGYQLADDGEQLDRAEKMIATALAQGPNEPAYIDSMGWLRYKQGRYADAAALLQRALDLRGEPDPIMHDHVGDVLWRLGKHDEALQNWKKAMEGWELRGDEPTVGLDNATREKTAAKVNAAEADKSNVPVAPLGKGVTPPGAQRL